MRLRLVAYVGLLRRTSHCPIFFVLILMGHRWLGLECIWSVIGGCEEGLTTTLSHAYVPLVTLIVIIGMLADKRTPQALYSNAAQETEAETEKHRDASNTNSK